MKEREISLVELIVDILLHWRGFVVWMLAGAVLFGAFSYVRSWNTAREQEANVEAAKKQLEQNEEGAENEHAAKTALAEQLRSVLTEEQIRKVNYAAMYERMYADKLDYLDQSLIMRIDPSHVQKGNLTFYISSDDWQRSHDIKSAYENLIQSGELVEYVAGLIDGNGISISEGIALGRANTNILEYDKNLTEKIISGNDNNIFRVEIIHYEETVCREMTQAVVDFIKDKHKELEAIFGGHEIVVIDQSVASVTDIDIINHQANYLVGLDSTEKTIQDVIRKKTGEFSEAEQRYYEFLINGEVDSLNKDIVERGVTVAPGIDAKYILLGMVLMAIIYAFILFLAYVLNTRIRATDQLQELYGFSQLGMIPEQEKSRKLLGIVDKWILFLKNRNRRTFTREEALELASVAVKMAAGKEDLTSVCLMGCDLKEQTLAACKAIKERLEKEHIQVGILNNILYDAQAMEELENVKGVVLVEKAGNTRYSEIESELELLRRQSIKVLGGIVVE